MIFTMCSSSRDGINNKYLQESKRIIDYVASLPDSALCWGCGNTSIMGLCYDAFKKKNIYGFTTPLYEDMLSSFEGINSLVCDDTFLLKKKLYDTSDVIVILPGGLGTVSELFAFLEEARSNKQKPIIICNIDHCYDFLDDLINKFIDEKFNDNNLGNYYKVVLDFEEFKTILKGIE